MSTEVSGKKEYRNSLRGRISTGYTQLGQRLSACHQMECDSCGTLIGAIHVCYLLSQLIHTKWCYCAGASATSVKQYALGVFHSFTAERHGYVAELLRNFTTTDTSTATLTEQAIVHVCILIKDNVILLRDAE